MWWQFPSFVLGHLGTSSWILLCWMCRSFSPVHPGRWSCRCSIVRLFPSSCLGRLGTWSCCRMCWWLSRICPCRLSGRNFYRRERRQDQRRREREPGGPESVSWTAWTMMGEIIFTYPSIASSGSLLHLKAAVKTDLVWVEPGLKDRCPAVSMAASPVDF